MEKLKRTKALVILAFTLQLPHPISLFPKNLSEKERQRSKKQRRELVFQFQPLHCFAQSSCEQSIKLGVISLSPHDLPLASGRIGWTITYDLMSSWVIFSILPASNFAVIAGKADLLLSSLKAISCSHGNLLGVFYHHGNMAAGFKYTLSPQH